MALAKAREDDSAAQEIRWTMKNKTRKQRQCVINRVIKAPKGRVVLHVKNNNWNQQFQHSGRSGTPITAEP